MTRWLVPALRAVIVAGLVGLVFVQAVVLPLLAVDLDDIGFTAFERWRAVGLGIVGLATVEVALVCVWRLLTRVRRDTVFSRDSFRDVDVVIGCAVLAALLAFVLGWSLAPGETAPGVVLVVGFGGIAALGVALLVLVLRLLLAQAVALDTTATTLRAELDEVV